MLPTIKDDPESVVGIIRNKKILLYFKQQQFLFKIYRVKIKVFLKPVNFLNVWEPFLKKCHRSLKMKFMFKFLFKTHSPFQEWKACIFFCGLFMTKTWFVIYFLEIPKTITRQSMTWANRCIVNDTKYTLFCLESIIKIKCWYE